MIRYQNKKWLTRYGIIGLLFVVVIAAWSWAISMGENKFYIQTEESEDDFVVICRWRTSFLGLEKTRSRIFIGTSNTDLDCGWSYGKFSVEILHPVFRTMRGFNYPYSSERYRYEDGKMIFKALPFDEFLASIQKKYQSQKFFDEVALVNEASGIITKHFGVYYFYYYAQVSEPDIEYLKSLYDDRLIKILQPIYSEFDFTKKTGSPESIVMRYWKLWEEYDAEI